MKKMSYIGILIYSSMEYICVDQFLLTQFMNHKVCNDNILQRFKRVFKRM